MNRLDDLGDGPQGTWIVTLDDPALEPWLDEVSQSHPELDREGIRGIWDYTTDDGYRRDEQRRCAAIGPIEARPCRTRIDADQPGPRPAAQLRRAPPTGRTNLPDSVVERLNNGGQPAPTGAFTSSSTGPGRRQTAS